MLRDRVSLLDHHCAFIIPLRSSDPLRQFLWACWLIQSDAPNYCKGVFQSNLQTGSEGWRNEGNVGKVSTYFQPHSENNNPSG